MTNEQIAMVAYEIWESQGRPDGEQPVPWCGRSIKLRDLHWFLAEAGVRAIHLFAQRWVAEVFLPHLLMLAGPSADRVQAAIVKADHFPDHGPRVSHR